MTGYDFHPEARFDLDEIWEFIGQENLAAADRTLEEILSIVRALVPFPNQGHRRPDLTSRPVRFVRVRDYLTWQGERRCRGSNVKCARGRRRKGMAEFPERPRQTNRGPF